jgi:hypothetical protein
MIEQKSQFQLIDYINKVANNICQSIYYTEWSR